MARREGGDEAPCERASRRDTRQPRPTEIIRIIVWCKDSRDQVEADGAEQMRRYGAETTTPN
jgi:hypothetical protein